MPGQRGQWDGIAKDNRLFIINAILWILQTGTPWRDLRPVSRLQRLEECSSPLLSLARFADKGYDSDVIVRQAQHQSMQVQILPRKNRQVPRTFDKHLYRHQYLVENAFLHLKRWCGIVTRYERNLGSLLTAVQIRCLMLWLNTS